MRKYICPDCESEDVEITATTIKGADYFYTLVCHDCGKIWKVIR